MPALTYLTIESAFRRADVLKARGLWPGVIGPDSDGRYRLTHDPDLHDGEGGAR